MFVPELGLADILKSRSNGFLTGSEPPHEAAHYAMQAQSGCRAPRNSRCHCFAAQADDYRSREPKDVRVLVVGPTGYIGRFVTKELIQRGYQVVAFAREKSGIGGKSSKDQTTGVLPLLQSRMNPACIVSI